MGQFVLKVGIHEGLDRTQKPRIHKNPDGTEAKLFPRKIYRAGETVESEIDLVERFGPDKFAYPRAVEARSVEDIDRQMAELQRRREQMVAAQQAESRLADPAPTATDPGQSPTSAVDPARLAEISGEKGQPAGARPAPARSGGKG